MDNGKTYKWRLRKGGKKMICPNCGEPRFVPYVLASDGKTIAKDSAGNAIFGRCDRENNCGYHKYPTSSIDAGDYVPVVQPPLEPIRIDGGCLNHQKTNLYSWAVALLMANGFERWVAELVMESGWEQYQISSHHSSTVFPQIDKNGKIRALKAILYKDNGHRDKNAVPAVFLHKFAPYSGYVSGEELHQCFFGLHLAARAAKTSKPAVALVESEKTALVMSAIAPVRIWLATGGSQMIKSAERCRELSELTSDVLVLPDNGQLGVWREVCQRYGWAVCNYLEWHPLFGGCDVLDYVEAGKFDPKNFDLL